MADCLVQIYFFSAKLDSSHMLQRTYATYVNESLLFAESFTMHATVGNFHISQNILIKKNLPKKKIAKNSLKNSSTILSRRQKFHQKIARNLKEPKAEIFFEIQRGILESRTNRALPERLPKWHFLTLAWNSKIFWVKCLLLMHCESAIQ